MTAISRSLLRGRVHRFGAHVTTDHILPGRYLDRPYEEVGHHAMAGVDEEFASRVRPGDLVVAGPNFGCGSSREAAAIALKEAGVAAVIAPSFGGIFFRNAINNGLVPVVVGSVDDFEASDDLEVDLGKRVVRNRTRPEQPEREIRNLRGISVEILEAGGIVPYTRRRMGLG